MQEITKDGYKQIRVNGGIVREHRYVWERANGPIQDGMLVHHVNGNKLDNRLENLELISRSEHSSIHGRVSGGQKLIDGIWHKTCRLCEKTLPVDNFRRSKKGYRPYCKPCQNTERKLYRK